MSQADFTIHIVGNNVVPIGESGVEFLGVFLAGGEFTLVLLLFTLVFLLDQLALGLDGWFFGGFFFGGLFTFIALLSLFTALIFLGLGRFLIRLGRFLGLAAFLIRLDCALGLGRFLLGLNRFF